MNEPQAQAGGSRTPGMLTLLRHGQSEWNREGRFTGWTDVDLSDTGRTEAERAGRLLAREGRPVDLCFTSMLSRAVTTSRIALEALGQGGLPVEQDWRLNERHYGALQGLGVWPAVKRFGPLTVLRCRRRFNVRPPALHPADPRFPGRDPLYASLPEEHLPTGESRADTLARLLPCWEQRLAPEVARGRHVLVVSHHHAIAAMLRLLRSRVRERLPRFRGSTGALMTFTFEPHDLELFGLAGAADGAPS